MATATTADNPVLRALMDYHIERGTGYQDWACASPLPQATSPRRKRYLDELRERYGCGLSQIRRIAKGTSRCRHIDDMLRALGYKQKSVPQALQDQAFWELSVAHGDYSCPDKYHPQLDDERAQLRAKFERLIGPHVPTHVTRSTGSAAEPVIVGDDRAGMGAGQGKPADAPLPWLTTPALRRQFERVVALLADDGVLLLRQRLAGQLADPPEILRSQPEAQGKALATSLVERLFDLCAVTGEAGAAALAVNSAVKSLAGFESLLPTTHVDHICRAAMQLYLLYVFVWAKVVIEMRSAENARRGVVFVDTEEIGSAVFLAEGVLGGRLQLSPREDLVRSDHIAADNCYVAGGNRPGFSREAAIDAIDTNVRKVLTIMGTPAEKVKPIAARFSAASLREYLKVAESHHDTVIRFLADTRGANGATAFDLGLQLNDEIGIVVVAFGMEIEATKSAGTVVRAVNIDSLAAWLLAFMQWLNNFRNKQSPATSP